MRHRSYERLISMRLDGLLDEASSGKLDGHLRVCAECRRLADELSRDADGLSAARETRRPDLDGLYRRTMERYSSPEPTPSFREAARLAWAARLGLAAAAAAVVLCAGLVALRGRSPGTGAYPAPQASGRYEVAGGGAPGRGSVVRTGAETAAVVLGGYCRVEMQPESSLRIEGSPRAEEIRLNRGEVQCSVDRAVGSFRVRTDAGTVSVTGTEFAVSILEELGETRMHVRVSAGSVLLRGIWGEHELKADQEVVLPRRAGEAEPLAEAFGSAVGSPTVEHEGRLYVLRGSTLARMNIRTMEVEARAEVPAAASSAERAVMLARGGMLYVLRGGMLFAFDEKGLGLKSSVRIAEPEEAPRMPRWGRAPAEGHDGHGGRGRGAAEGEAPRAKPDEGTDEAF